MVERITRLHKIIHLFFLYILKGSFYEVTIIWFAHIKNRSTGCGKEPEERNGRGL